MGAGPVVAPQGLMRMAPQGVALPHLAHQGQSLRSRKRQVGPAAQAGQQPGGARVALGLARVLKTGPGLAGSHTLANVAVHAATLRTCDCTCSCPREQHFHALEAACHVD